MKIAVIGTGYVGLVTGTGFSEYGNEVICVDVNKEKISKLNNNIMPIYEPGLEALVKSNKELNRLKFTTDIKYAVNNSDIIFIAVGTPPKEDGDADLSYIYKAAEDIGKNINSNKFVVDKSTVPVGTADKVKEIIKKNNKTKFIVNVISNPEFLKEGTAINDFIYPDRIVIGADCEESFSIMRKLYSPQCKDKNRIIEMDIKSAELTKYAANAMLATRISFMNELANISEKVGADINKVRLGIGSDSRIGPKFLYPGCGYGGSCFPKDVKAIISTSKSVGYNPTLLQEVDNVNNRQKIVIYKKIINRFKNIKNKVFGIWGLSFKPDTDDMREKLEGTFSGGFDAELEEFLEWYVVERKEDIWTKELYLEYQDWHNEMATGDIAMKEKAFSMKLGKTISKLNEKGYVLEMRKTRNDKGMSLNRLFIGKKEEEK